MLQTAVYFFLTKEALVFCQYITKNWLEWQQACKIEHK